MKKGTRWALIGVSCCLLATLARACAPKYGETQAQPSNNQAPIYNYVEDYENAKDGVADFFVTQDNSNTLGR